MAKFGIDNLYKGNFGFEYIYFHCSMCILTLANTVTGFQKCVGTFDFVKLRCTFQIPIHAEGTKFVTLCGSFVSALLEQGMFYWFGGELLEAVRIFCVSLVLSCSHQ